MGVEEHGDFRVTIVLRAEVRLGGLGDDHVGQFGE
jgi:hypothetical protein